MLCYWSSDYVLDYEEMSSKLEKQEEALKNLRDKVAIAEGEIQAIASTGKYKLKCRNGTELEHNWICYKYKYIKRLFGLIDREIARKYWYECNKCYYKMTICERLEY